MKDKEQRVLFSNGTSNMINTIKFCVVVFIVIVISSIEIHSVLMLSTKSRRLWLTVVQTTHSTLFWKAYNNNNNNNDPSSTNLYFVERTYLGSFDVSP